MKKYLVAIDGSGYSIDALETAIKFAKKAGGTITLITVLSTDALGFGTQNIRSYNSTLDENTDKLRSYLDEIKEKYASDKYEIEKIIRIGNISNEIIEESEKHDLLFIGSRGLGAVKRAFLGSVSGKVINNVDIPAIVVKEDTEFNKILVPVDGSRHSKKALITANEIGKYFDSKIILLNVINSIHLPQMETFDLEMAINFNEEASRESGELLDRAGGYIDDYPNNIELISSEGDAASIIVEVAEENDVDLIVMGSKGLGAFRSAFMGSVSTDVVNKSSKSVLINH